MNFYLTLPSNASSQIYSENKPGHYRVKLPRNIFLPENDWEVALASISFPDMVPRMDNFIDARVPILVRSLIHTKIADDDGVPIPVKRWIDNRWQIAKELLNIGMLPSVMPWWTCKSQIVRYEADMKFGRVL